MTEIEQKILDEVKLWSYIPGSTLEVHFSGWAHRWYQITLKVPTVDVRPPHKNITISRSTEKARVKDLSMKTLRHQIQDLVFSFANHEASEWLQRKNSPVVVLHGVNHEISN